MNKARLEAILEERKTDYSKFQLHAWEYFEEVLPFVKLEEPILVKAPKAEVKKEEPKKVWKRKSS